MNENVTYKCMCIWYAAIVLNITIHSPSWHWLLKHVLHLPTRLCIIINAMIFFLHSFIIFVVILFFNVSRPNYRSAATSWSIVARCFQFDLIIGMWPGLSFFFFFSRLKTKQRTIVYSVRMNSVMKSVVSWQRHVHFFLLFQPALIFSMCNRVYCIHVPGHDPLIFSFLSFSFLIGWEFYGPS